MRGTIVATIYVGRSELVLGIEYWVTPGERPVRYYPDGSGYPGSPTEVECLAVHVSRWTVDDEDRRRGSHWIWEMLDRIARRVVEDDWDDQFRGACLEHDEKKADW